MEILINKDLVTVKTKWQDLVLKIEKYDWFFNTLD